MKLYQLISSEHSNVFLYFIVLFANIDYTGVLDYSIKALVGSAIWFVFKLLGEYLLLKLKEKQRQKQENEPDKNKEQ